MFKRRRCALRVFLWGVVSAACLTSTLYASDNRLEKAEKFVASSDKYLHHSKLKRGMKGYGLTVMNGVKPQRFDAEIVSVVVNFGAGKDVILANLSGLGLEKTRIISGMSGSPVYMKDPTDGKYKMIGAVAYGWSGQQDPLCGIQPITQMLAAGGLKIKSTEDKKSSRQPFKPQIQTAWNGGAESFVKAFTVPEKKDFSKILLSGRITGQKSGGLNLVPLKTPLMVSGVSPRTMSYIEQTFNKLGMTVVQSGAAGGSTENVEKEDQKKFVPGGVIVVPFARGDLDLSGLGTVTEIIGDQVFAFGHSMFSAGEVNFPVAPGYIHTVVSNILTSFKLGAGYEPVGTLYRDEEVAIVSNTSKHAKLIPMKVTMNWPELSVTREYNYEIVSHDWLTALVVRILLMESANSWSEVPVRHNVEYNLEIDFDDLGVYRVSNISTMRDILPILSDAVRPISILLDNPFGSPAKIKNINVSMTVRKGNLSGAIKDVRISRVVYKPGETINADVTVEMFRKPRATIGVSFKLPEDIEPGDYLLQIGDWQSDMRTLSSTQPQLFTAKNAKQIFDAMQRAVEAKTNKIYMRLVLKEAGLAIDKKELPDLPASKALLIGKSKRLDTKIFVKSILQTHKTYFLPSGSVKLKFKVVDYINELNVTGLD